jgi:hypothetical protein
VAVVSLSPDNLSEHNNLYMTTVAPPQDCDSQARHEDDEVTLVLPTRHQSLSILLYVARKTPHRPERDSIFYNFRLQNGAKPLHGLNSFS